MTKLVVDIGNTRTKIAVFNDSGIIENKILSQGLKETLNELFSDSDSPSAAIVSSVTSEFSEPVSLLKNSGISYVIALDQNTPLPIRNSYQTPETLGTDRLANVCGAWSLYPDSDILVVDIGTCIKFDFISKEGDYQGGSISPGLDMRYKALNRFTGKLPLLHSENAFPDLTGQSTGDSIRSGVENGIMVEIQGIIGMYLARHNSLNIILTGGDCQRFEDKLKSPIFVTPNLTLTGLKAILEHNEP